MCVGEISNCPFTGDNMLEATGDIWDYDTVIITTNGFIKKDGTAVMGRGIAYEATRLLQNVEHPVSIQQWLGEKLTNFNNIPFDLGNWIDKDTGKLYRVYTFPTKHHWKHPSIPTLIEKSAKALVNLIDEDEAHMPRPGCGNGRLLWEDVKPRIESILDDRFIIHSGK